MSSRPPVIVIAPPNQRGGSSHRYHMQLQEEPLARHSAVLAWGVALILMYGPLAFGAVEPWSVAILEGAACLLFLAWGAGQASQPAAEIHTSPLFLPMGAFAAVVAGQLMFHLTRYPHETWVQAERYGAYAFLAFVAAQSLRNDRALRRFLLAMTVFGAAVAMFAIVQYLTSNGALYWVRVPREGGNIFGPYVNRNHYAGLMELLTGIPLVLCFSRRFSASQRGLLVLAAILMAGSVLLSGSRAGSASLVAQVVLVAVFGAIERKRAASVWMAGLVFVGAVALLFWVQGSDVLERFTAVHVRNELTSGRLAIAGDSLRMWREHPVWGFGLGNFAGFYPQYRSFYTDLFVNELHNDYLQLLVETGVLGFAAGMWFVLTLIRGGVKVFRGPRDEGRWLRLAAMTGCTGLLAHSLADFNLQIPANAALFYVLAVVTCSRPESSYSR